MEKIPEKLASGLAALGSMRARVIIAAAALVFTIWQGYIFVWVPLQAQVQLPAGVTPILPTVDADTLAKIQMARVQRLQHAPNGFAAADQYFAVPSASPPPS